VLPALYTTTVSSLIDAGKTASLKVIVIFVLSTTSTAPSAGEFDTMVKLIYFSSLLGSKE
jgi:hypothetical protein